MRRIGLGARGGRIVLACLAFALLGIPLAGCGPEAAPPPPPPRPVKAMRIIDPSSLSANAFPGRASPGREANLSFRVAGPLIELPVSEEDRGSVRMPDF